MVAPQVPDPAGTGCTGAEEAGASAEPGIRRPPGARRQLGYRGTRHFVCGAVYGEEAPKFRIADHWFGTGFNYWIAAKHVVYNFICPRFCGLAPIDFIFI